VVQVLLDNVILGREWDKMGGFALKKSERPLEHMLKTLLKHT